MNAIKREFISDVYEFKTNTALEANFEVSLPYPTSRKIYRHSSNEGSVIEFDMYGSKVKLFVADAKYRAVKQWGAYGVDTALGNFNNDINSINPADSDNKQDPLDYNLTDVELQSRFSTLRTISTAKASTDILMQYNDTEAAHWCRAQSIDGIGNLDLPNIYELMVIYLEADNLDALDPTAGQYPNMMLGHQATNGRFYNTSGRYWSSTEFNNNQARHVRYDGQATNSSKQRSYGTIPVKEL